MLKNNFFKKIQQAESECASEDELKQLIGKGRAKKGMFEGDIDDGELEIGQVSATIKNIQPAAEILSEIWMEFNDTYNCR
jgi:enoyl-[acyl-carrier protein] reductase II